MKMEDSVKCVKVVCVLGVARSPRPVSMSQTARVHMPLVGVPHPESCICYLLGCNAWGQSSLSYAATLVLVPGLLGVKPLSSEQQASLAILDMYFASCEIVC